MHRARRSPSPAARRRSASGSREAVNAHVVVELDYTGAGLAPSSPRVVPAQLITRDGFGYLQAWSLERGAWRTYRLDRISAVRITDGGRGQRSATRRSSGPAGSSSAPTRPR